MTEKPVRVPRGILKLPKAPEILKQLWKRDKFVRELCESITGEPNKVIYTLEQLKLGKMVVIKPNDGNFCPDCSVGIVVMYKFCPWCGASLKDVKFVGQNRKVYTLTDRGRSVTRVMLMEERKKGGPTEFEEELYA